MNSEELSWNIGETTVGATLTVPDEPGISAAVAFIAGSGPTARQELGIPFVPRR